MLWREQREHGLILKVRQDDNAARLLKREDRRSVGLGIAPAQEEGTVGRGANVADFNALAPGDESAKILRHKGRQGEYDVGQILMSGVRRGPGRRPAQGAQFKYRPRYGVIVVCDDEVHQRRVFERLRKERLQLRVVVV